MINDTVDLYEYFGIDRNGMSGGYLTPYVSYLEEMSPRVRPAMLVLPGGGYGFVSEREGEPIAMRYAVEGFSAFVLRYSIFKKYPVPLLEACMAVIYIRENADKYRIDPNLIAAIGFSAGGHLAGMLANICDEKEIRAVLGDKVKLARINAVLLSYAVATLDVCTHGGSRDVITGGDKELMKRLSPEKRVTKNSPPAFIWHTYEDDCVPVENSMRYADACLKNGVPFALHIFEKGWHGMSLVNSEVNDGKPQDLAVAHVGKWFELSVDWLSARGFKAKVKDKK